MVRKRRCSVSRCSVLLSLLALAALLTLIMTTRRLPASAVISTGRSLQPVTAEPLAAVISAELEGTEEPFDLGPDPFDDTLRQEALRNLTRARVRLAAARGIHGSDVVLDPVSGTAMRRTDLTEYYEVRRRAMKERIRAANESEVAATLLLLREQLETELHQLPAELPQLPQTPPPVFLATTWRSGSTFLGHVLSAHPGVFTHYEPLSALGVRQARSEADLRRSRHTLDELLACRYTDVPDYMNATRRNTEDMLSHNPRVWRACQRGPNRNACVSEAFMGAACRLLPRHLFKLVRLRLRELEPRLRDGARVLFLVRDPRATVSSRLSSVRWCRRAPECVQPAQLCADLADDLAALRLLQTRYPAAVRLVRYEELAAEPLLELRRVFQFVGFAWTAEVQRIVSESTQSRVESSEPWAVQKNSALHVARWKQRLSNKQVAYVDRKCRGVIEQLGYDDA